MYFVFNIAFNILQDITRIYHAEYTMCCTRSRTMKAMVFVVSVLISPKSTFNLIVGLIHINQVWRISKTLD